MADEPSHGGGAQAAAKLASLAKSAVKIIGAAATSGPYGAAAAAVKEALPLIIKVVAGILAFILVLVMVVIYAIPAMFFGFVDSVTAPIVEMTDSAELVGEVYMALDNLSAFQVDSIITSIIDSLVGDDGFDRVIVDNYLSTVDLDWIVAITSVYYQQNVVEMDPQSLTDLIISLLDIKTSLLEGADGGKVLRIIINPFNPNSIMDLLSFNEDQKLWAKTLHETLEESDGFEIYRSEHPPSTPNISGDPSGPIEYEHGGAYENGIDISGYVDPHTKNNKDLVTYATRAYENNWGYVWGTYGNVLSQSLFEYKLEQYPDGVGKYKEFIENNWLGRRTTDCVGLIKGYGWLNPDTLKIQYGTNGMPDYSANGMYQACVKAGTAGQDYGPISSMPEIPGLALWKDGHIGVYIGGGYAVEASGTKTGVVKTKVAGRGWSAWCKLPYINYLEG